MIFLKWLKFGGDRVGASLPLKEFAMGKDWLPFGSTLLDVEARGIAIERHLLPKRNAVIDVSGDIFGLPYGYVEAHCFAAGRPIEQVWYQLPLDPTAGHLETIRQGHKNLVQVLGRPTTASGDVSEIQITSTGDVVFHATWRRKHYLLGTSWFGDTRHEHGLALSGMLYQHWDDEKAAAKPYLSGFHSQLSKLEQIPFPIAKARLLDSNLDRPSIKKWYRTGAVFDPASDRSLIEAQRALYSPRLLLTPRAWSGKLPIATSGELVMWQSKDGLLGFSTPCDTWIAEPDELLVIDEFLTHPAKGPGSHAVRLGEIEASVSYIEGGNPAIRDFIASIKSVVQAEHRFHESSDC